MSDFMIWLYQHYIKPQLDAVSLEDYSFHFDLMKNETGPHAMESFRKTHEFTAVHAFLLGLRTGRGLPRE